MYQDFLGVPRFRVVEALRGHNRAEALNRGRYRGPTLFSRGLQNMMICSNISSKATQRPSQVLYLAPFGICCLLDFRVAKRTSFGATHHARLALHWLRCYRLRARHPSVAFLRPRAEEVPGRGAREAFGDISASPELARGLLCRSKMLGDNEVAGYRPPEQEAQEDQHALKRRYRR